MNTKLHAVTSAMVRPIRFCMPAGGVSGYTGAAALLGCLPKAGWLLADQDNAADRLRDPSIDKEINVCIPNRDFRK